MKIDYVSQTADIISSMRLLVEGAIVLYEGDALPLDNLARQADLPEARDAFNTIGKALYDLRQNVVDLETACREEVQRQLAERA